VGPTVRPFSVTSTPCDRNDSSNKRPRALISASSTACLPERLSNDGGGRTHSLGGATGVSSRPWVNDSDPSDRGVRLRRSALAADSSTSSSDSSTSSSDSSSSADSSSSSDSSTEALDSSSPSSSDSSSSRDSSSSLGKGSYTAPPGCCASSDSSRTISGSRSGFITRRRLVPIAPNKRDSIDPIASIMAFSPMLVIRSNEPRARATNTNEAPMGPMSDVNV